MDWPAARESEDPKKYLSTFHILVSASSLRLWRESVRSREKDERKRGNRRGGEGVDVAHAGRRCTSADCVRAVEVSGVRSRVRFAPNVAQHEWVRKEAAGRRSLC